MLQTKQMPIEALAPFPGNARNGDTDTIGESLEAHGQYRAIVVWAETDQGEPVRPMQILAGNHTYLAAGERGAGRLLCHLIACSADEAKRINLVDNRANDLAGYDNQALADLLKSLEGDLGDPLYFAGTGYDVESLEGLLARITADEEQKIDAGVPQGVCPECEHEAPLTKFKASA